MSTQRLHPVSYIVCSCSLNADSFLLITIVDHFCRAQIPERSSSQKLFWPGVFVQHHLTFTRASLNTNYLTLMMRACRWNAESMLLTFCSYFCDYCYYFLGFFFFCVTHHCVFQLRVVLTHFRYFCFSVSLPQVLIFVQHVSITVVSTHVYT